MKRAICILTMGLLLAPACGTNQNAGTAQENRDAEAAREQRRIYQEKAEEKLREIDRQIDRLGEKMKSGSEKDRTEMEPQMADLQRRREIAREKLERFRTSSREAWHDMEAGLNAAMDDLEAALKRADSHFN
jgi:uncharacterized Zn finger protein (UPF0148 family)